MIGERLARQQICVRLPGGGDWTDVREDRVSTRGVPRRGGGFDYPDKIEGTEEPVRAAYDLLTELGLYMVEEEAITGFWPGRIRHYKPTPLGKAHIRLVPGGHGASGWYGLCYGARRLTAIEKVGPVKVKPCETSRTVYFTYHYDGIPAWADDPRLRRFFADIIDAAAARIVRHDGESLGYYEGEWFVRERIAEPYFIPCIGQEDSSPRARQARAAV
jgi:hypothetical protein